MRGDGSAYATLGLDPDADWPAVEQAYRRLIKQHHPDRAGGDSDRAADITRAFREIRASLSERDSLEFNIHPPELGIHRGWGVVAAMLALGMVGLLMVAGPIASDDSGRWSFAPLHRPFATHLPKSLGAAPIDPVDQPLNDQAIDAAAVEALHLSRTSDEIALAAASRNCHHGLRTDPTIFKLDRCAAFDDAVVLLQDRDPLRDQGPFSELSVTGRAWNGAAALSDDYLAIDGRLDRIKLRVEMRLALAQAPSPMPAD